MPTLRCRWSLSGIPSWPTTTIAGPLRCAPGPCCCFLEAGGNPSPASFRRFWRVTQSLPRATRIARQSHCTPARRLETSWATYCRRPRLGGRRGSAFSRPGRRSRRLRFSPAQGPCRCIAPSAGIPGAIAYRTNPVTYLLGRWLVKVPFIGIANLLLGEAMYPEFIQGAATSGPLAAELAACVDDPRRRQRSASQAQRLRAILRQPISGTAADWLERWLPSRSPRLS